MLRPGGSSAWKRRPQQCQEVLSQNAIQSRHELALVEGPPATLQKRRNFLRKVTGALLKSGFGICWLIWFIEGTGSCGEVRP